MWFKTIWFNLPEWKEDATAAVAAAAATTKKKMFENVKRIEFRVWSARDLLCVVNVTMVVCERARDIETERIKSKRLNERSAMTLKLGCNEHNRRFNSSSSATRAHITMNHLKFEISVNAFIYGLAGFCLVVCCRCHSVSARENDDS